MEVQPQWREFLKDVQQEVVRAADEMRARSSDSEARKQILAIYGQEGEFLYLCGMAMGFVMGKTEATWRCIQRNAGKDYDGNSR